MRQVRNEFNFYTFAWSLLQKREQAEFQQMDQQHKVKMEGGEGWGRGEKGEGKGRKGGKGEEMCGRETERGKMYAKKMEKGIMGCFTEVMTRCVNHFSCCFLAGENGSLYL